MRKLFAFLVCVFFLIVLVLSSWNTGMQWLTQDRYARKGGLGSDKYTFGDLYGLSYLPEFKISKDTQLLALPPQEVNALKKKCNLTLLGDSYFYSSFKKSVGYFPRVKKFNFVSWSTDHPIQISTNKAENNVLFIEVVERNMHRLLQVNELISRLELNEDSKKLNQELSAPKGLKNWLKFENVRWSKFLFHPTLEVNLDFLLFNMIYFSPIKEWKAGLNYRVFGRTAPEVHVSKKGHFLYLSETTDPVQRGSSFEEIDTLRLNQFVNNINEIDVYFKKRGFNQVIFSIIPNPVGILKTEGRPTNHIIERIEKHPELHAILINPSLKLSEQAQLNFYKSDSHWNQRGAKIWLDLVNAQLNK